MYKEGVPPAYTWVGLALTLGWVQVIGTTIGSRTFSPTHSACGTWSLISLDDHRLIKYTIVYIASTQNSVFKPTCVDALSSLSHGSLVSFVRPHHFASGCRELFVDAKSLFRQVLLEGSIGVFPLFSGCLPCGRIVFRLRLSTEWMFRALRIWS